jgi:hypothetical protein
LVHLLHGGTALQAKGWALFSGENPAVMSICIGEQHVATCAGFATDLRASMVEAAAAAASMAKESGEVAEGASNPGGSVSGPYQSGGGVDEQAVEQMLVGYIEHLVDFPGIPASRL